MDSKSVYNQIQQIQGQMNPMLDHLPGAADYFKKKVGEAYQYNLPVMQNAAELEGKMYSLPGELMGQYNQEFGGQAGVDAGTRINSILNRLGTQSALSNTAWGLVDRAGMRNEDLAKSLLGQYTAGIDSLQAKMNPLMSIWDRLYSEEQANKRSARSNGTVNPFAGIRIVDNSGSEGKAPSQSEGGKGNLSTLGKVTLTAKMIDDAIQGSKYGSQYDKIVDPIKKQLVNIGSSVLKQGNSLVNQYNNSVSPLLNIWK